MDIFIDTIKTEYLNDDQIVLDIETTGVDRINCYIQVVGLLSNASEDNFIQIGITTLEEEFYLLEKLAKMIHNKSLITFNGINFDLPFIFSRMNHHGIDIPVITEHFDIYRFLIDNRFYTKLNVYGLQALEQFQNIDRFEKFELEKDKTFYKDVQPSLYADLLLHNKYDVVNTEKTMSFVDYINANKQFTLSLNNESIRIELSDIRLNKDILKISLASSHSKKLRFENPYHMLDWSHDEIKILARVTEGYLDEITLGYVYIQKSYPIIEDTSEYELREDLLVIYHNKYLELNNIINLCKKIIKSFI